MVRTGQIACLVLLVSVCWAIPEWYMEQRREFIREEKDRRTGAELSLNPKETLVNHYMMLLKYSAFTKAVWTNDPYPAGGHFFEEKARIDESILYKIFRKMPKGGVLHVHSHAMTSLKWVIENVTYMPNLYTKKGSKPREYLFSAQHPGTSEWDLLSDVRAASGDVEAFDKMLLRELHIFRDDPKEAYPSLNDVWAGLSNYFFSVGAFWDEDAVNQVYFRQALKEFYADGVQYIEIRGSPEDYFVRLMINVTEEFQKEHPDFIGVKHICAKSRTKTKKKMEAAMDLTMELMKKYPDLVKGFDMVSQEDITNTQKYYLNQLLDADNLNFSLPYFFHAGETDWTLANDQNLVDAVLLNATRIGHGYALLRHPKVMERVRRREIAVELNPISNQVLGLVGDLRNHPGAIHLANGDPVVVSSDDPVVWLADPLSHDFYYAFMAMGAVGDDLRLVKQLIINSFIYSAMTEAEKKDAIYNKWLPRWNKFIDDIIEEYNLMDGNFNPGT